MKDSAITNYGAIQNEKKIMKCCKLGSSIGIYKINSYEAWITFFEEKVKKNNLSKKEEEEISLFIKNKKYELYYKMILDGLFPKDYPVKKVINKASTNKKRIVYSYDTETNIVFKFIAFNLYEYDYVFSDNCYAFRKGYGVKNAINRLKFNEEYENKYCFKADISDYFNSIDPNRLLEKLLFF